MPTEKPNAKKIQPRKVIKRSKKKNKGGRPKFVLTDKQRKAAIDYVTSSGFWKTRLAKFMKISFPTLELVLKRDKSFFNDIEAADATFVQKMVERAKPEFILRSKYKDEFPENNFDPGAGQGGEELEAVILRIRKILPPSGQ